MTAPSIFISYSHKDEGWKDRLLPQLRALELAGRIVVWDDRKIDGGDTWYPEIQEAMEQAAVALCLISPDYLASRFCVKEEVPYLLQRRERERMALIPVLLRPCPWQAFEWLSKIQMLPRDGKSVAVDFRGIEDAVFAEVANLVLSIFEDPAYEPPAPPPPVWPLPEKADTTRMPRTGAELFGRRAELQMLDGAWESEGTNIVSLVAWGGVGKSTLVNKWLERSEADNYRGARRVYAWSFYSQGTNERVTSADLFINNALEWFGDPEPTAGSPWDKGERLARLVSAEKTLLILDGLEPLQSPHAHERGKIKDPALSTLLTELARENQGLCLITTRERVTDLEEFSDTAKHVDLEQISDEAGRALLRVGGVRGTDAELEQATRDFGNHALAVQLLAVYLHEILGHNVSNAAEIPDLDIPVERGKHPRRMLAAFEQRFGPGPEVELLRMLGLYDRPADAASLAALRKSPPIPGLTDHVEQLSEADWLRTIAKLRRHKLIAPASHHHADDGTLDAHPLVREHFGEQLKQDAPDAWREGNSRLYEHLRDTTKELPDTIDEMTPLYAAIAHGCAAGRYQEALYEVFRPRVHRNDESFSRGKLGAYGAELTALSGFFDSPWTHPVPGLSEASKASMLGYAGFVLRAVGQLRESTEPMLAALRGSISWQDWKNAAIRASNLSETYLTIGHVSQALTYAQQSVEFANQSGDDFQRLGKLTTLANTLHKVCRLTEAGQAFLKAEKLQNEYQPDFPLLYSLQGFEYCDLLFTQGNYREVQARATQTLGWAKLYGGLLSIALDYLSLGLAYFLQSLHEASGDLLLAADYLNHAVDGFRHAGTLHHLPRGLMARAWMRRSKGEFDRARIDLDEAMSIASRGSMGLHQADCHLEYARLYMAGEPKDVGKAREHLRTAKEMIGRMGYHLRDEAVRELEAELEET
ncbi:MAG TPA: TIR domain-containing protein [Pyrinomonadaceae bacterium]|nr:TIR domain-containing protein [Pyrinomonadaceae bacterium]